MWGRRLLRCLSVFKLPHIYIELFNTTSEGINFVGFGVIDVIFYATRFDTLTFFEDIEVENTAYDIVSLCGIYGLALGSFLWSFFRKDVSAEKENTKGSPCVVPVVSLHAAVPLIVLASCLISFKNPKWIAFPLVLTMFTLVAYFFLNVLYNHGFKLKKMQWIPMIPVAVISFALVLILSYIPA